MTDFATLVDSGFRELHQELDQYPLSDDVKRFLVSLRGAALAVARLLALPEPVDAISGIIEAMATPAPISPPERI